ncbi:MAG: peptidylprolyl isomerase [Flavobacteriales bacterium]|nr:peptidylprolyl isomerase [Flavobacteriales bacterium]
MHIRESLVLMILVLLGCGPVKERAPAPLNHWADERMWSVLEAQEHRDTPTLCGLLKDGTPPVRAAAALAFASVQDSLAMPCLLEALHDSVVEVRVNALFALGFIANEGTLDNMADVSSEERDSTVQRAYMSATFLNLQRSGRMQEVDAIVYYLERNHGQERCRAADALRRLPPTTLRSTELDLLRLTMEESDPEVKALLIRSLGHLDGGAHCDQLRQWARHWSTPSIRISAIRALARCTMNGGPVALYDLLADTQPMVRAATLAQLNGMGDHLRADSLLMVWPRIDRTDTITRLGVLKLLRQTAKGERFAADTLRAQQPTDPYARAEWITAMTTGELLIPPDSLRSIMLGNEHPAIRQAAFHALQQVEQQNMMMPRALPPEMLWMLSAPFYRAVFTSGDAGLICAATEGLQLNSDKALMTLFPKPVEEEAMASLRPIQDLEAIIGLRTLAARRDGLPVPGMTTPPFNHPIDRTQLLALKQGQRYRIVTGKGEIIIATDVDACPGSSLAFDSLVASGYYDGKAFHRVVPDFVVQGGCPRGDGYGGMPWTLRTEISRKLFTTGSVGLASAGRDTESCQFFITHSPAPHLDGRYTRFGEVVSGMDVVGRLEVGDVMERVERIN